MTEKLEGNHNIWSVLALLIRSKWLLVGIVAAALGLAGFVHLVSKPGSEISLFWGLAKYPKAETSKTSETKPAETKAETDAYSLPDGARTRDFGSYSRHSQPITYAILDQAISFTHDDEKTILGGAEIAKISIAARNDKGEPLSISRHPISNAVWILGKGAVTYLELSYKGNLFSIEVWSTAEEAGKFGVKKIKQSSLSLRPYEKL